MINIILNNIDWSQVADRDIVREQLSQLIRKIIQL